MSTTIAALDALKRQINRAERDLIEQRDGDGVEGDEIALLFTGNWHDSIPRRIILSNADDGSQTLSPVERLTWMVFRVTINDHTKPGSMPRRADLASMIGCSTTTVTASREMLRVRRWMTYCKTVRKQGRFVGDIYLLHDEPLSLEATLELDSSYIEFLERVTGNRSKKNPLKQAAADTLREIDALRGITPKTEIDLLADRVTKPVWFGGWGDQPQPPTPASLKPFAKPEIHQGKNLALVPIPQEQSQEQILALAPRHQDKNLALAKVAENDQGKNLALAGFSETHQGKDFTLAVNSSFCSSSLLINNINTRAKTDEGRAKSLDYPAVEPVVEDEYDLTEDPMFAQILGHEILVKRYLPEINYPVLNDPIRWLFATRNAQIPMVARLLKVLPKEWRRQVLFQLLAKGASDFNGWSVKKLGNLVGYTKALIEAVQLQTFKLDEVAVELLRAVETNRRPYLPATPEVESFRSRIENPNPLDVYAAKQFLDERE
jgi:hypothetical protein